MLQMVIGPLLFAAGLCLIFLAVHGMPKGISLGRLFERRPRQNPPAITAGDALVAEMLSEMIQLREQLAELQSEVGTLKERRRRPATRKLATEA
jgi:hypothetical protein